MRDIMHVDTLSESSSSDDDDILVNFHAPARNVRQRTSNTANANANAPTDANAPSNADEPSNAARIHSNSNAGRVPILNFLNIEGTAIRSAEHAAGMLALIQTASAHQDGIIAALGSGSRTAWITANIHSLFRGDGALRGFRQLSVPILMRRLREAQLFTRRIYDGDHSNDQTGASHEEIPPWVRAWFQFFEAQQNQETNHARASRARSERASTVASVVGRQGPLGVSAGNQPVEVRTETSRNEGAPDMREQVLGDHETERVNVSVEGRDDAGRRTSANNRRNNGSRRRNIHTTGSVAAGDNNPSARFESIRNGYDSLNRLTDAISHSFVAPQQQQAPSIIEIVRNYAEITTLLENVTSPGQEQFYRDAQARMHTQLTGLGEGNSANKGADDNQAD